MSDDRIEETLREVVADGVFLAVRLDDGSVAAEACRAAIRGGLRLIEMTLTTPGALDTLRTLAAEGEGVIGAGTVLNVEDVRRVAECGARFAMSPVTDEEVIAESHRLGMLAVPGAGSATEILRAHRAGARLVKVFPCGPLGGPEFLRKIRGPLPHIPLVPTSGPSADTLAEYLAAGATAVGVGTEVFPRGFTPGSVEGASRRLRKAMDGARAAR